MIRTTVITLLFAFCPVAFGQAIVDPMTSDPVVIDPTKPPNGPQIMQLFLLSASASLQGSGCLSTEDRNNRLTLRDRLAMVLGEVIDRPPEHKGVIHGRCIPDESDAIPGRLIDTWQCELQMEEVDENNEYIADASVSAHFTRDTWSFVPGTIRCL